MRTLQTRMPTATPPAQNSHRNPLPCEVVWGQQCSQRSQGHVQACPEPGNVCVSRERRRQKFVLCGPTRPIRHCPIKQPVRQARTGMLMPRPSSNPAVRSNARPANAKDPRSGLNDTWRCDATISAFFVAFSAKVANEDSVFSFLLPILPGIRWLDAILLSSEVIRGPK